jgi:hypothetical protein
VTGHDRLERSPGGWIQAPSGGFHMLKTPGSEYLEWVPAVRFEMKFS